MLWFFSLVHCAIALLNAVAGNEAMAMFSFTISIVCGVGAYVIDELRGS
jgi:hypothetical protein